MTGNCVIDASVGIKLFRGYTVKNMLKYIANYKHNRSATFQVATKAHNTLPQAR